MSKKLCVWHFLCVTHCHRLNSRRSQCQNINRLHIRRSFFFSVVFLSFRCHRISFIRSFLLFFLSIFFIRLVRCFGCRTRIEIDGGVLVPCDTWIVSRTACVHENTLIFSDRLDWHLNFNSEFFKKLRIFFIYFRLSIDTILYFFQWNQY